VATAVNLDGRIVPPEQATVPVFDRGFLYGDSVYEVVRTYAGVPFALDRHLERLEASGARLGLQVPWSRERFTREVQRTLDAAGNGESYVRIVVTRGSGPIGLDPALAQNPLTVVIVRELEMPPAAVYQGGVQVQVVSVLRNLRQAIDPRAKTGNYLNNVLALAEAKRAGAFEAVMLDADGQVTEGSTSNVFVVRGGVLQTPPLDAGILEGVTRGLVLEVARALGVPAEERPLVPADLLAADEMLITSTVRELVPVVRVGVGDRVHPVGAGVPGPVTARIRAAFHRLPGV
jgi:branched-chain amino acid aminotransferase